MQIIENTENKESIYELVYDEESIRELISDIIKNCSIRKQCKSTLWESSYEKVKEKIDSAKDYNGNEIYKNVSNIKQESFEDPCDYWRWGDPVPYSFTSDKLLQPELVNFLIKLLNGENISYDWFINKEEIDRKQNLELEIQKLDSEINKISNFDIKRKIDKLKELEIKIKYLANIPEFNYDLLSKYYNIAQECIQKELISETVKFQKNKK